MSQEGAKPDLRSEEFPVGQCADGSPQRADHAARGRPHQRLPGCRDFQAHRALILLGAVAADPRALGEYLEHLTHGGTPHAKLLR